MPPLSAIDNLTVITVTLPDGSQREFPAHVSVFEIAAGPTRNTFDGTNIPTVSRELYT